MDVSIVAVGKAGRRPEAALAQGYLDRLSFPARIIEVEERRPLSGGERKKREGEKVLAALPANAFVIVLDEHGKQPTSMALSQKLQDWFGFGRPLAFVIGGADGHGAAVLARADATLSLSNLTWPHMLVRVMLAEQIYRAMSIFVGHPYHRE
ncbi:ribosomal RNA large subunit methyltransferase H [Iodidimonas muriae]|uniref:Ribosomal RNA large subunit methyltransferase H n=1 Tax=Iodidimonas muriae TaxID=261467 RepID=A0ABQ2LBZ3_9PROT|nr:23S rRNA (pseudouridine(1915)-N(3))-methyltransferase RlmH [Iodidimonas muriae]GER06020.1 ribosomal RNA large subunit methyltransferase H [Kordiimonadales bacterium JCM 17843]GGO07862.1 ribosomal RNA large subunit methyltransferase H [Iodidimonas muriae]